MTTKCIIIAAGEATRWKNHLGVPKHLVPINGTPILERTVKLINHYPDVEVYVVAKDDDERYKIEGSTYYEAKLNPANNDADKFLSSEELWNPDGRTIVFYGDTYFTRNAMKTIMTFESQEWTLFSSKDECFAQSFYPEDIPKHRDALHKIRDAAKAGGLWRCGGWEHYRAYCHEPLQVHKFYGHNVQIDDLTDDFDYPDDYELFMERYVNTDLENR